ncbi:MAG TPA: DedA family protein [Anaerolineales bacterium]|nr:DedA family protein [Anaerolineales bacterium]
MELITQLFDFILHIDKHLGEIIAQYGYWTYSILFTIVFLETGVVVTPFLPGDSLLFAAGAIAATGALDVWVLFVLLAGAAILGDTVNYWIGNRIGPRVFEQDVRFFKREYLERTQKFYEKHGGKTIFLARFIPIIRTFAPFVAGVGTMRYRKFIVYNVVGALVWTSVFIFAGYYFGNIPFVRDNFGLVVIAIILISVLPVGYELIQHRLRRASDRSVEPPLPEESA